jgi:TetR/AcrR family transcriptional regulator, cholesterol catabolism regulator
MVLKIFDNDSRQGEICIAAVQLFYQKGYHATGMRELAAMLGMTVANVYNFFNSKEDLLFFVLEKIIIAAKENLISVVRSDQNPVEQLSALIISHIQFHGGNQQEALVSDSEVRGLQGDKMQRIIEHRDQYESIFRQVLEAGIESGHFAPVNPKMTTIAIITMCTQVAYWYKPEGSWTLDEIASNYCDFAQNALVPKRDKIT